MVKRKVARRGFEMKWMAVVIAGSALLAQGGLATAKESALPPRECAAKAQAAAMKLRDMASAIEAEADYAERPAGPARSRLKRVRHLSTSGVSGAFRYFGTPTPRRSADLPKG